MAISYSYENIILGGVGITLRKFNGDSETDTIVGGVQSVTPPSFVRSTTELPNGLTTPEIKGPFGVMRYAVNLESYRPDAAAYFESLNGAAYPIFNAVRLAQTHGAVGPIYRAVIDEVHGSLISWEPQATAQDSPSVWNLAWLPERFIQYSVSIKSEGGKLVRDTAGVNQVNASPPADGSNYSNLATAPAFYYDPQRGEVYIGGKNQLGPERALADLASIVASL